MKKVLYFNTAVGSKNLGDYIINLSIKKEMEYLNRTSFVCELPTHTKTFGIAQKIFKKNVIKSYNHFDYKFLCGTNAIYTSMLRPMPVWNISLLDRPVHNNVILIGAGLGVNRKNFDRYTTILWQKVLSKNIYNSVRDLRTQEFLESIGIPCIYTGCPTTWSFTPEYLHNIPKKKATKVVFTLTSYRQDERDKKMLEILDRNYEELYFFPQGYEDISYLESFDVKLTKPITIVGGNIESYDTILNSGDIDYVGNRLHGGVFALQHQVRSIIIGIDHRVRDMLGEANFVVERKDIDKIEEMINSEMKLQFEFPIENVKRWKSQFDSGLQQYNK